MGIVYILSIPILLSIQFGAKRCDFLFFLTVLKFFSQEQLGLGLFLELFFSVFYFINIK